MTLRPVAVSVLAGMAGLLLASCATHNATTKPGAQLPELSGKPYWQVFRNVSSHSSDFFRRLVFGRVFVHEYVGAPGIVSAKIVRDDGQRLVCYWGRFR